MRPSYYAARANLYYLRQHHPDWSPAQFAAALGYSEDWSKNGSNVSKRNWLKVNHWSKSCRVIHEHVSEHLKRPIRCGSRNPLDSRSSPGRLAASSRPRSYSLLSGFLDKLGCF